MNIEDYAIVGCPSCGAQHKRFNAHDLIACWRCWRIFYAVDARLYEHYKKCAQQREQ